MKDIKTIETYGNLKFTMKMDGRNFEMQALDIESRDFWVLSLERLREKIK